eukprot:scaffold85665_cov75-Attheya_sp.AAC.1
MPTCEQPKQGQVGFKSINVCTSVDSGAMGLGGEVPARTMCYARLHEEVMIFEHSLWPQA